MSSIGNNKKNLSSSNLKNAAASVNNANNMKPTKSENCFPPLEKKKKKRKK